MTYLCDQLGVNARSIADIILYDKALTASADDPRQAEIASLHATVRCCNACIAAVWVAFFSRRQRYCR